MRVFEHTNTCRTTLIVFYFSYLVSTFYYVEEYIASYYQVFYAARFEFSSSPILGEFTVQYSCLLTPRVVCHIPGSSVMSY